MAHTLNKLTHTAAVQAKCQTKRQKLFDGGGLYLLVQADGHKYWRMAYRYASKEKTLAFGAFPEVSLKEAREKREKARKLIAGGIDPAQQKRHEKLARDAAADNTFEAIALEWLEFVSGELSEDTITRNRSLLKNNLFPWLGKYPIVDITPMDLLAALKRVEQKGIIETAHRLKQMSGQILRYAVVTGRAPRDISQDLKGALKQPKEKHFAAITEPREAGRLLLAIDGFQGTPVVKAALQISPLVFQRPGEVRNMKWGDINFDTAEWRYQVTKTNTQHIVPLSRQAIQIIKNLQPLTASSEYVFPGARGASRPISENAVRVALRTLGYTNEQMTPHGFRAMARTILDEILGYRIDWIEHQLAHAVIDANGRAYNRTSHLEGRKQMMQCWADYLDGLRAEAQGS
jgi:integrase